VDTVDFHRAREILVESLAVEIKDKRVLKAFASVPRELFVPLNLQPLAYEDRPLTIGRGQTISQPYIVAVMTAALELAGDEKVLELGTGSGYQSAILSLLARDIYSVERIPELAESATALLDHLGYNNVHVRVAGDELGWPENAPYDAIIVTAGAPSLPDSLVEQLKVGGRMVIPVGSRWEQDLLKITRGQSGNNVENLGGCRFVPLVGKGAWQE
jgi:protein-L-isoaspartate(D-aspartate) O-methyltransferase